MESDKKKGVKEFFRLTKRKLMLSVFILIFVIVVVYLYNHSFTGSDYQTYSALLGVVAWPFIIAIKMAFQTQINLGILIAGAIILEVLYISVVVSLIAFIIDWIILQKDDKKD